MMKDDTATAVTTAPGVIIVDKGYYSDDPTSLCDVDIEDPVALKSVDGEETGEGEGLEESLIKQEKNPWSKDYLGIPTHYFTVGCFYAGTQNILYPILVVQQGETSAFYTAANNLVTLFWSYKVFFGFFDDIVYVRKQQWKPYIVLGWLLCAMVMIILASMGNSVDPIMLVIMLTMANFGYVMAGTLVSSVDDTRETVSV